MIATQLAYWTQSTLFTLMPTVSIITMLKSSQAKPSLLCWVENICLVSGDGDVVMFCGRIGNITVTFISFFIFSRISILPNIHGDVRIRSLDFFWNCCRVILTVFNALPNQFDFYRNFFTSLHKSECPCPLLSVRLKAVGGSSNSENSLALFLCLYLNVLWKHNFHSYLIGFECLVFFFLFVCTLKYCRYHIYIIIVYEK